MWRRMLDAAHAQRSAVTALRGGPHFRVTHAEFVGPEAEQRWVVGIHVRRQREQKEAAGLAHSNGFRGDQLGHGVEAGLVGGLAGEDAPHWLGSIGSGGSTEFASI